MDKELNQTHKNLLNNSGFSIIEVMIAFMLFAIFTVAFVSTISTNITDSELMAKDLKLATLCEKKLNEVLIDPPEFNSTMEDFKETKAFDDTELSDYKFTLEFKKMTIPDFSKLLNTGEEDQEKKKDSAIQGIIFDKMKENVEKILWQVRVTVFEKESEYKYQLSTWIMNTDAKVKLNFNF